MGGTRQQALAGVVVLPEFGVVLVPLVLPAAAVQQVVAGPEPELLVGPGGAAEQQAGAEQRRHQELPPAQIPPVAERRSRQIPPVVERR